MEPLFHHRQRRPARLRGWRAGAALVARAGGAEPLAYERYAGTTAGGSGTALELFRNRLGSVILAVSVSTGAVAAEYDYDSFGQRTLVQGTEEVRYGFTSREHGALTGLIYYRARSYDPLTGQFLQRDPIGFASGDLNLYAYVENDPYNWTDPSGLTSSNSFGQIARGSARTARGAVGAIGTGILNFARNFFSVLNSSRAAAVVGTADRAVSCASAATSAATGNFGGAAADGAGCVAGGTIDRLIGDAVNGIRTGLRRSRGTCSFDGATLVLTDEGYVPISEVDVADLVLSRDEMSEETAYQRVLDVYANHYDVTITLQIADLKTGGTQEIVSNEIHPFFAVPSEARVIHASSEGHLYRGDIPGGAWIDAAELRPGDLLLQDDGEWSEVVSVVATEAPLEAYNISVAEFHTYFVAGELGEDAVWVHNSCRYVPVSERRRILEDPNTPMHVRGFLQNQLNQGVPMSRVQLPRGYDWGHHPTRARTAHGNHTRLELSRDNRARGGRNNPLTSMGNSWR